MRCGRIRLLLGMCALLLLQAPARSQEPISFPSSPGGGKTPVEVEGLLSLPASPQPGKYPAVVLVHTAGGTSLQVTGRYAKALAEAGFVALEPVLFRTPAQNRTQRPTLEYMPKVYGALNYLAARPDVDARKIALAGFSLGGFLTIMAAMSDIADKYSGGQSFSAHAAFYPVCWTFTEMAQGRVKNVPPSMLAAWTGAPVRIFAGGKDDYDERDPQACAGFVNALPEEKRGLFSVQLYPDATHGWDHATGANFYERNACKGKGCYNRNVPSEETTRRSIS